MPCSLLLAHNCTLRNDCCNRVGFSHCRQAWRKSVQTPPPGHEPPISLPVLPMCEQSAGRAGARSHQERADAISKDQAQQAARSLASCLAANGTNVGNAIIHNNDYNDNECRRVWSRSVQTPSPRTRPSRWPGHGPAVSLLKAAHVVRAAQSYTIMITLIMNAGKLGAGACRRHLQVPGPAGGQVTDPLAPCLSSLVSSSTAHEVSALFFHA